jgi:hypothetical protein
VDTHGKQVASGVIHLWVGGTSFAGNLRGAPSYPARVFGAASESILPCGACQVNLAGPPGEAFVRREENLSGLHCSRQLRRGAIRHIWVESRP